MALRIGLSGLATLVGLALVAGCASEDNNTGLGTVDGGGAKAGFGGSIGGKAGTGGVNVGGKGGVGGGVGGGTGGVNLGGAGGLPSGGTSGGGGSPTGGSGGATGGAGGGGGTGGGGVDSCVGWCGKTDPAPGPSQCYCDTECFNFGDCCADYSVCSSGGGGTGGGTGGSGGSTGGSGGSTGGSGGATGGTGGGGSMSCQGFCGFQAPGGCWCDSGCDSFGDCCTDKASVCGSSTGGTGGGGTGGSGGSTGGTGGSTGGTGGKGGTGGSGGSTGGTGGTGGSTGGTGGSTGGSGGTGGVVGSCDEAEDCSNPNTMVCDPDTLTCGAGQCTGTQACATGEICLAQVSSAVVGACYKSCTPFGTTCGAGKECVAAQLDLTDGACFSTGTKTEGQACTDNDVSTGCVAGDVCVRDVGSYVCRKLCNYFASSPACLLNQRCEVGGVCTAESGDSAALGGNCSVASVAGESCGNDGKAWRGTCQDTGGTALECLKVCRTAIATDCKTGETCIAFQGDNTAGVCF